MSSPSRAPRREQPDEEGPFRASQLKEGTDYELANGHPIRCMGSGERHGLSNARGAMVINTDPALGEGAGVDVAYEFNDGKSLRAPDISAGTLKDRPGWAKGAPALAIEYADRGQDEHKLQEKIRELLAAGTRYIWVVRLVGPLRVEVYRPRRRKLLVGGDKVLTAKGVLQNPVPVRSLVDRGAANEATLRNLLNQMGYDSLEAVRDEGLRRGRDEGRDEGLRQGRDEGLQRGRDEGLQQGRDEGRRLGLQQAVHTACELLGIKLSAARRRQIEAMDAGALETLCAHLRRERAWPRRS